MLNFARLTESNDARTLRRFGVAAVMGALLLGLTGCGDPAGNDVALTAEVVEQSREDMSTVYDTDCYASRESTLLTSGSPEDCTLTHPDAEFSVVMVGDSHSAHWLPPVEAIAEEEGWNLAYFGKRGCSFGDYVSDDGRIGAYEECNVWNENLREHLREVKPDVVIVSSSSRTPLLEDGERLSKEANEPARAEGMRKAWQGVVDDGSDLVAILDTPYLAIDSPKCLLENLGDTNACSATYVDAVTNQPHPDKIAASNVPEVETVQMADQFCPGEETCYSYLRNNIVFRDGHHMTASFALSLEDELALRFKETEALSEHI
ncbi:hypothetical protein ICM05_01725 [Leucobacter sp. cx-42]|uniref:SGNH hydrolase domain-containing protein n=1 Tax=unclassified Leucobacter TaxID=2621730 RepID=UPI00165D5FCD|nr:MULTISPECIES: SGNH hydrolase domain-containing protein [unclassified Leucobacter]MBC9953366.1 hypothetical protein [Leucobacter sp. cx-42]